MWSRRPPEIPQPRAVTPGLLAAQAAQRDARDGLMEAIEQGPRVREVVERAREHVRRNHLGELFTATLQRRS